MEEEIRVSEPVRNGGEKTMRYNHLDMLPDKAFRPVGKHMTLEGGGGSKGGGSSTNTTTSYSTNLPEYAQPYYQELLKQSGRDVFTTDDSGYVTGVKPFTPYTGERVAGFTPAQQAIQQQVAGLTTPAEFAQASTGLSTTQGLATGAAGMGFGQAMGYAPTTQQGGVFDQNAANAYMSPYQTAVTDAAIREARQQADINRQNLALGSVGRGTFGGARQALIQSEQDRGTMQNLADIRAKGQQAAFENAQKMFEADQARRLRAAEMTQQGQQYAAGLGKDIFSTGLAGGIDASKGLGALAATQQTSNLERLKTQAASAEEQQALQQQLKDIQYQQFREQQDFPKQQLEFYSNILRGNAGALGSTQVQYAPQPSAASQIAGLGIAGLGLYNMLGGQG